MIMHDIVYMLSSKVYDGYLSPRPLSEGIAIAVLVNSGRIGMCCHAKEDGI